MSEEESASMGELLDSAIGTPEKWAVNFSALRALLEGVLRQLHVRGMETPRRSAPEEDRHRAQQDVSAVEREVQPSVELGERVASSSSPPPSSPSDSQWTLRSRIQTCEDGVSKAMKLIQELHDQKDNLKEEMKEAIKGEMQEEMKEAMKVEIKGEMQEEMKEAMKEEMKEAIKEAMKVAMKEEIKEAMKVEMKEVMKVEMKEAMKAEMKELCHQQKGEAEPVSEVEECCRRVDALEESVRCVSDMFQKYPVPERLSQTGTRGVMLLNEKGNLQETPSSTGRPAEAPSVLSGPPQQTGPGAGLTAAGSAKSQKTGTSEALRNVGRLMESFSRLEAHVAALEERKVDRSQLTHLRELVNNKSSQDASKTLMDQLNQQRALIDSLMSDQQKLDSQDPESSSEAASGSQESERRASCVLRQQMSDLRKSVQELDEEVKQLKAEGQVRQDLLPQQPGGRAGTLQDRQGGTRQAGASQQNVDLVKDVQGTILQLQSERETSRGLHDDKRSQIEELNRRTEELEETKADKLVVERELKADKCALENKVSRLLFDSVTEQLNAMLDQLLNKLVDQDQNQHCAMDRLSTECKLNRMELDSVKKQLEDRCRKLQEKLQAQEAPELDDAAVIRRQLLDRYHCLSCDRPVVLHSTAQHQLKLAPSAGFPLHRSIRPFTVYALEPFRQHYRSERISETTDYVHQTALRSCGGSHTVTSASQRRNGLQQVKQHAQSEGDTVSQSEEVDIVGLDGHIYKGRLNASAVRNTETKLPTISTKEGKSKDKARCSLSPKAAASPEVHRPHSAKSSRSASSSSGRDWPVSPLGCTSQSCVTPSSAAAESNTEPHADESLHL